RLQPGLDRLDEQRLAALHVVRTWSRRRRRWLRVRSHQPGPGYAERLRVAPRGRGLEPARAALVRAVGELAEAIRFGEGLRRRVAALNAALLQPRVCLGLAHRYGL